MISRTLFFKRGLQHLMQPQALAAAQGNKLFAMPARDFGAKRRKGKRSEDEGAATADEFLGESREATEEPVAAQPSAASQATHEPVSKDLFTPFSVGNIKRVDSTPDHQPPSKEDTIEGRYAGVLFTYASQESKLFDVFEDMKYLQELFTHCESFRLFTENQGVGEKEIKALNEALSQTAPFSNVTLKFLEVLATNKRLVFISQIADRYSKLYQEFNKEEKVTIISAAELTAGQKEDVLAALRANPNNQGKEFTVEYQVDETILGGLQMYTESEFMDMSLASRLARLNEEVKTMTV